MATIERGCRRLTFRSECRRAWSASNSAKGIGVKLPRRLGQEDPATNQSPVIWRCSGCGAIVHVSDPERPLAWCSRSARVVEALRDGGRVSPGTSHLIAPRQRPDNRWRKVSR